MNGQTQPVRVGVIEVGSRAVRLLVADVAVGEEPTIVGTDWQETGFAEALTGADHVIEAKVAELSAVVARFATKAEDLGATRISGFGTAAVRQLARRDQTTLKKACPTFVILTPRKEAEMSLWAGVLGTATDDGSGTLVVKGRAKRQIIEAPLGNAPAVIDQGSGSMEIVVGAMNGGWPKLTKYASSDLGTTPLVGRLRDKAGRIADLRKTISDELLGSQRMLAGLESDCPIIMGSAVTKLAWILVRTDPSMRYSPRAVHKQIMQLGHIQAFLDFATANPTAVRELVDPKNPNSSEYETVVAGLAGLEAFLSKERRNTFVVSAHGTRYGLAWQLSVSNRNKARRADSILGAPTKVAQ
jgi:exopolyphosphatase/pppGpp-phosphohydrolase